MKSFALVLVAAGFLSQTAQQTQTVIATVTNRVGEYIPNLKKEDFVLEENGVAQQLTKFSQEAEVPISLGILIDKSTSMRLPVAVQGKEKVPAALLAADGAARVIIKLMKAQDEYMIMDFDEKVSVKQPFTTDKKKVTDLLYKNNLVGGSTHLYHAIGDALKEIKKKAKNPRRVLVVITDVHDTSGDKIEDLQATIREQEIPVFTFGMRWDAWGVPGEETEPGKATYEEAVLRMMAAESAGHSMVVDIPNLLSDYTVTRMIEFVTLLGVELRGQYTLSYNSSRPSEGRAIRLRMTAPELQVRFRPEVAAAKK